MRFDSLQIPAFGPFTDFRLDFPESEHDLHLIHGPNEAGKSSLLRAIRDLLYGIPTRTSDNFVHEYSKLLIGATVSENGRELSFLRKKALGNTLLDSDQNTLDQGELQSFLGSVNQEFFEQMFGIDSITLREGADALLAGEGDLGEALFSASRGGSSISVALDKLREEADQLFSGVRGRKADSIVIAKKAFEDFEKESRDLSTSAHAWKTLQREIQQAEDEFETKDADLSEKRARKARLDKLIQAIPLAGRLQEAEKGIAAITLPELPSDFPERVREAQKTLSEARILREKDEDSLKRRREQLDAVSVRETLLEDAPELESLSRGIGQHLEDLQSHRGGEEARRQLQQTLAGQLDDLGLDSEKELTALPDLGTADLAAIEELAEELSEKEREHQQADERLAETGEDLDEAQAKLDGLGENEITPEVLDLRDRVAEHGQNAGMAKERIEEREEKADELDETAAQLGLDDLDAEEIRSLVVPATAVLEKCEQQRAELEQKRDGHRDALDRWNEEIIDKEAEIEKVAGNIAAYSREDLVEAREQRDARWDGLATKLEKGETAEAGETRALSDDISRSDEIADALRDHAKVLGELANLKRELERLENQRDREQKNLKRLEGELAEWEKAWRKTSRFLGERDFLPAELIDWRRQWEDWCAADSEFETLTVRIEDHQEEEADLLEELREHFGQPETDYRVLSRQLDEAVDVANTAKGERKTLTDSLASLDRKKSHQQKALAAAAEALEAAREDWTESLADHGFDDNESTQAVLALLRARRDARESHRKCETASEELSSLARRIGDYQERLAAQRKKHLPDAPDLDPQHPDRTEKQLAKALAEAKEAKTRADALEEEIGKLKEDSKAKESEIAAAEKAIDALVAEAKLDSADGLSEAIAQFEKRQGLVKERETAHRTLVGLAGNTPVEDFLAEVDSAKPEALQSELDSLAPKIDTLQQDRDDARDARSEVIARRTELERAEDGASHAKQQAANALARTVADSERFIRLHHAIALLEAQVEAYREKSQGPMIEKTSGYFSTLTRGSFARVAAQADDKDPDRVKLVALRQKEGDPDGIADSLGTDALSEGTRDQLYLALRLAAIEHHLEKHAPMPLILDDILMTFDDERSESVFEVLKTLSGKTQVLVFTHHRHIAELAGQFIPGQQLLELSGW